MANFWCNFWPRSYVTTESPGALQHNNKPILYQKRRGDVEVEGSSVWGVKNGAIIMKNRGLSCTCFFVGKVEILKWLIVVSPWNLYHYQQNNQPDLLCDGHVRRGPVGEERCHFTVMLGHGAMQKRWVKWSRMNQISMGVLRAKCHTTRHLGLDHVESSSFFCLTNSC